MQALVGILPAAWQSRAKAIVAAFGGAMLTVAVVIPDAPKWLIITVAALTALGVHQAPAPGYTAPGDTPAG